MKRATRKMKNHAVPLRALLLPLLCVPVALCFAGEPQYAAASRTASAAVASSNPPASFTSFSPTPADTAAAVKSDPVLTAMQEELARSKSRLKMDNVPAPFYIEYRLVDTRSGG